MPGWDVHSMTNVWTNYGEPVLYGSGKTDLTKQNLPKINSQ